MDRREQIAHLAATREEEMLLVRVCEKLDTAVQRDIPTATNFLSKREQMLVCEVLRGAPIRFFGGLSTAEREISCYLPDYLDEDWLTGEDGPVAAVRAAFFDRGRGGRQGLSAERSGVECARCAALRGGAARRDGRAVVRCDRGQEKGARL